MLHNVINFHFPPSAKLFVHRCGRAARQGRIGYSFSLVEPEEIAYMMDIHLFLNKPVKSGYESIETIDMNIEEQGEIKEGEEHVVTSGGANGPYTLTTMTPDMVHTGLLVQDAMDAENEYVKSVVEGDLQLSNQYRVCENAMKQYHRTRSEASREGIKAARDLVKRNLITSIHPLVAGCDATHCHNGVIEKAAYVRALQSFRPSQTVLETGIGTGSGKNEAKQAAKLKKRVLMGGTTNTKDLHGVEVMQALRKVMCNSLDRNRSRNAKNNSIVMPNDTEVDETLVDELSEECTEELPESEEKMEGMEDSNEEMSIMNISTKPRISIAEKRRLKKHGSIEIIPSSGTKRKNEEITVLGEHTTTYKDKFYMSYGTENEHASFAEKALQPQSYLRDSEKQSANMLEQSLLG